MADLTCPTCKGTETFPPGDPNGLGCWDCGDGRRLPTLAEWDALCAAARALLGSRPLIRTPVGPYGDVPPWPEWDALAALVGDTA